MKNSTFVHSKNILLVIFVIWIISIGCKNSNSNNANSTTKEISGEVFPANEVCKYPDSPIIKKYGGFNSTWGKRDTEVDLGADFRYICNPYPSKLITLLSDASTDTKIQLSYDARGNQIEGAHTIYMEYRAVTEENAKQLLQLDQKYRKDVLLPLVSEIVKKALKQPLTDNLTKTILSGNKGKHRPESCEKVGNGLVCVDDDGNEKSARFAEIYIFANEEALKSNLES